MTQYILPTLILSQIQNTFNISHSFFSSLITCSTILENFISSFLRDKVFGSLDDAFTKKWIGIGYANLHHEKSKQ